MLKIDVHLKHLKIEIMTIEEINTLENKVFRFECERFKWQSFRDKVEKYRSNEITFGFTTELEKKELDELLESIKYY